MIVSFKTALASASLIACTHASGIPEIPHPTNAYDVAKNLLHGWTPKPTEAAHLDLRYNMPLFGRQQSSLASIVGYFAPDATCGYLGGEVGAFSKCPGTSTCAAVSLASALGCCGAGADGGGECYFFTACLDYTDYQSSCDVTCKANANVGKCTASSAPYCQRYTVEGLGATGYNCDTSVQNGSVYTLFTTFNGQSNGDWSTFRDTLSDSSLINQFTDEATGSVSAPGLFTTVSVGGNNIGNGGNNNNNSNNNDDGGSSTPVGAIVGGVVGGLAAVALIILGIWLILRRKKKNAAAVPPHGEGYAGAPPPMSPAQQLAQPHYTDPKPPYAYQTQPQQYDGGVYAAQQNAYQPPVSPQAPSPNNANQTYYPPPQHNPQTHPGIPEAPTAAPPTAVELGGDSVVR